MARFHLPFSTMEETLVRATFMYLLRQYFENKNDKIPNQSLQGLHDNYNAVKIVNASLLERIKDLDLQDSDKNAILILHSISDILSMEIDTNLSSIEHLFA